MDRRSTSSLLRDYAIPMQDPNAFSLQYGKDTTSDPNKIGLLKKKKKDKTPTFPLTDQSDTPKWSPMLDQSSGVLQDGGKVATGQAVTVYVHGSTPKEVYEGGKSEPLPHGKEPIISLVDKKTAPKNLQVDRFGISKAESVNDILNVPKQFWKTYPDGMKVYNVDDNYVKIYIYPDFTEGGNPMAYPEFVPAGEYWLSNDKTIFDKEMILLHESTEYHLMKDHGLTYDKAHPLANKAEMAERTKLTRITNGTGLLKKGGKVGNPKDRNKAGGSNVGKYSKSEGPFAGPSGGSPAGSYPIGSKSRGKSALKLAHNAPNPGGIKAAVYRKYPDLKPKKAMEGAKLGLRGMGQMQDKAPIPTKYNAPPDKVKGNFALYKRKRKVPKSNTFAVGH